MGKEEKVYITICRDTGPDKVYEKKEDAEAQLKRYSDEQRVWWRIREKKIIKAKEEDSVSDCENARDWMNRV